MVKKILWVDTETTGLDPDKNEITQLSCIYEEDGVEKDRFNCFMAPERTEYTTTEALAVQGKTLEEVLSYPSKQMGFVQFVVGFLEKHVNRFDPNDKMFIFGKNVEFDKKFLYNLFCERGNKYFHSYFHKNCFSLEHLAILLQVRGLLEVNNLKLITLAQECGYSFPDAHDARADVEMTRRVYANYMERLLNSKKE